MHFGKYFYHVGYSLPFLHPRSKQRKVHKEKGCCRCELCLIFTFYMSRHSYVKSECTPTPFLSFLLFSQDAKPKTPERDGTASKVAPAKKPKAKNVAGEGGTEPKQSKTKKASKASKGVEEPATKKAGKKTAKVEGGSGEKGAAAATKAPGRRGKKWCRNLNFFFFFYSPCSFYLCT